jgi:hypothetical protein
MDWAPYIIRDSDEGSFTGRWIVYSRLGSDSEHESATLEDNSPVPETARRTRRTASAPHLLIVVGHRKAGADTKT